MRKIILAIAICLALSANCSGYSWEDMERDAEFERIARALEDINQQMEYGSNAALVRRS